MQAATTTAGRAETVVYVDTGAGFSGRRMANLCGSLKGGGARASSVTQALKHVEVHAVHDVHTLLCLLDKLAQLWQARLQRPAVALEML